MASKYLQRYGKDTKGDGWYSFDYKGVHFIGLVNVVNTAEGGLGVLGTEQLEWLEKDVKGLSSSTPIIVFTHIPLWEVYPQWGWGTRDSAQALSYLKRFGSVSVLNGHIHQTLQKVEGNITFHTASINSFPATPARNSPGCGPYESAGRTTAQLTWQLPVLTMLSTIIHLADSRHCVDCSKRNKDGKSVIAIYDILFNELFYTFFPCAGFQENTDVNHAWRIVVIAGIAAVPSPAKRVQKSESIAQRYQYKRSVKDHD